jgi:hypothetical protein
MSDIAKRIDAIDDRRLGAVLVKEWPDAAGEPMRLLVRSWSSGDRLDFDAETGFLADHLDDRDRGKLSVARVVAWCVIDDAGALAFELPPASARAAIDRESDEAAKRKLLDDYLAVYRKLAAKNGKALQRIYNIATELNVLSDEEEDEIEKN